MEQHTLICLGKLEDVTYLFRGPALDVAQADHDALCRRERLDRRLDQAARLRCEQLRLRRAPRLRERRPAARVDRVLEPVGIDGRLARVRVLFERGERT